MTAPIEDHYQLAKRWEGEQPPAEWRAAKGRKPDFMVIEGVRIDDISLMTAYYDLLWVKYLDVRPQLVSRLRLYDDFVDPMARRGTNSQADSIRKYVKQGRASIMNRSDVRRLVAVIRQGKEVQAPDTVAADRCDNVHPQEEAPDHG